MSRRNDSLTDSAHKIDISPATIDKIKKQCGNRSYTKQNISKTTTKQFNQGEDKASKFETFLRSKKSFVLKKTIWKLCETRLFNSDR